VTRACASSTEIIGGAGSRRKTIRTKDFFVSYLVSALYGRSGRFC